MFKKGRNKFILIAAFLFFFLCVAGFNKHCSAYSSDDDTGSKSDYVQVADPGVKKEVEKNKGEVIQTWLEEKATWLKEWAKQKSASQAFWSAIKSALKTIAYDTATWIGSGGEGQKPLFITEGWGSYLSNVADNAAGTFIEGLGETAGFSAQDLCEPDLFVKVRIGLGLVEQERPDEPTCTFTEMKENWESELTKDPATFLTRLQNMFEPTSNDLGIALTLQSNLLEKKSLEKSAATKDREENRGWLDIRNLAGDRQNPPGDVQQQLEQARDIQTAGFYQNTQDAFTDAVNVFLNQLAITAFNNLLKNMVDGDNFTSPYSGDYGGFGSSLSDYGAAPTRSGVAGAEAKFRTVIQPDFKVRGDYNILSELTMCPNPTNAGPTNCVLDDRFKQAIEQNLTLAEAVELGYLNQENIFGFRSDGLEPVYNEGYPYRTLSILRKYRIIPVTWEVAAQYIKDNSNVGTCNLGDMISCYSAADEFVYSSGSCSQGGWCRDLVDPTWVLKAPFNYCRREGPGPEILNTTVVGEEEKSSLVLARNSNYCADEQTCIKESDDGSCEMYGYCTEENRIWDFDARACSANFNTCQSFRRRDGKTASYLENTIDFGTCTADNVGCHAYCLDYDYAGSDFTCSITTGEKIFLDKDAASCNSDKDGCVELIRTGLGTRANLFYNSSFEKPDTVWERRCDGDAVDGTCSVHLAADVVEMNVPIFASSTIPLDGEVVTFSLYAKNCGPNGSISVGGDSFWSLNHSSSTLETGDFWKRFSVTHTFLSGSRIRFSIEDIVDSGGDGCRIDAIKAELNYSASAYSDYRQDGVFYEKLIPDYLNAQCYVSPGSNYELRPDAISDCFGYSRRCNADEVGCNLYTAVASGLNIPAKVVADDYCPETCVGYDDYLQTETVFDSSRPEFFIPASAKACGAQSVGCDEFTNLDRVGIPAEGEREGAFDAEATEYYKELRQCQKPSPACSEFYTWEGSSETGYQLRVHSFVVDTDNAVYVDDPDVIEDDQAFCDATIYAYDATDSRYNSDCREFFNRAGRESYHLFSKTLECSDNCHPYRRTQTNVVKDPITGADIPDLGACQAYSRFSSAPYDDVAYIDGQCLLCKGGGVWDSIHNGCIYSAIPDKGVKCTNSQAGCREYSGNTGNDIKIIVNSDFEGSTQGWEGLLGTVISNDSMSLTVGGESLKVNSAPYTLSIMLGNLATRDKSYYISFIAKRDGSNGSPANEISLIGFNDNNGVVATFTPMTVAISGEWKIYEFNLARLDHAISLSEYLFIDADGDYFIDNVRLNEITDRYYLIKNSWQTPDECYRDIFGNYKGPEFNLGCDIYSDRDSGTHYLHSFTKLCQESAAGCEIMIDTHNFSSYGEEGWNDGGDNVCGPADGDSCITVPYDNFTYAVYDPSKLCNSDEKGCQRLGIPYYYGQEIAYNDGYFKNDPDLYDDVICDDQADGCEAWTTSEGLSYFKDPIDQICEWREEGAAKWDWYKKKVKRCDTNGDGAGDGGLCVDDDNCATGESCQSEGGYEECPTTISKTFGKGGSGGTVDTPNVEIVGADAYYWVGSCSSADAGCTEYIDPVSSFSVNLLFNPEFEDIDGDGFYNDGWKSNSQEIDVEPYALYRMAGRDNGGTMTITCKDNIFRLDENNRLVGVTGGNTYYITLPPSGVTTTSVSALIYSNSNTNCDITLDTIAGQVEFKHLISEYMHKEEVDKESCNMSVNFEKGCVLFNERSQQGAAKAGLLWDSDLTIEDGVGITPALGAAADRDVNVLLDVKPDRNCAKWLACRSYVKDEEDNNVCFDIGLCNSLDKNGNCNSFLLSDPTNHAYPSSVSAGQISNLTGYAKAGHEQSDSFNPPNDMFPLGTMKQWGELLILINGGFELFDEDGYTTGWYWDNTEDWNQNVFKAIHDPVTAQNVGSCYKRDGQGNCVLYTPEGKSFLRMGTGVTYNVISEYFDVTPNTQYNLTAMIQTQNLSEGQAQIEVENAVGGVIKTMSLDAGNPWTYKMLSFNTNATNQIRLRLKSSLDASGSIFYDSIKINPVLNINPDWNVSQTCRLYPEDDSLSCNYYEDSGAMMRGWYGYCLEYDRPPGDKDACLLWWPVERVRGDSLLDQGGGYYGKYPLYYCLQIDANFKFVENRQTVHMYSRHESGTGWVAFSFDPANFLGLQYSTEWEEGNGNCEGCGCGGATKSICPEGYWQQTIEETDSDWTGDSSYDLNIYCVPNAVDIVAAFDGVTWYKYNGDLQSMTGVSSFDEGSYGLKILKYDTAGAPIGLYDPEDYIVPCTDVAKTISNDGTNKVWSARLFDDSEFVLDPGGLDYEFDTFEPPYGSIVPPNGKDTNPVSWNPAINNYPDSIYGNPYSCFGAQCAVSGECSGSPQWCTEINEVCLNPVNRPDIDAYFGCPTGESCDYVNYGNRSKNDARRLLMELFAQSYGMWTWDGTKYATMGALAGWGPPGDTMVSPWDVPPANGRCNVTGVGPRPAFPQSYCAILPYSENILVDGQLGNIQKNRNSYVNFTFTTQVDENQLPLVMYAVDWGDLELTTISGLQLLNRTNPDYPNSLYHLYSYWDMRRKFTTNRDLATTPSYNENQIYCGDASSTPENYNGDSAAGVQCPASSACCVARPGVQIKDNWGWCSNGSSYNDCGQLEDYDKFASWVIITED